MSTDFIPTLVEDDRLILTSKLPFEIYQGASSVSPQVFAANTQTGSSHTYTVTVPSYESITDMNIMYDGDMVFTIIGNPGAGAGRLVNLGNVAGAPSTDCFAPFPFLQNIIVASATINQSQVSVNCQDVLPALLSCISRESLSKYNDMTPTMLDNCQSYTQAGYVGSSASVFNPYLTSGTDYRQQGRGAWRIKSITGNTAANAVQTVVVTVHVTEPLGILSPFLFAKPGAGISGVQAINFNLTLDATASRAWRTTSVLQSSVTCAYQNSRLLVNFLSPKASQLVKYSPRNILPYSQLSVYKSNPVAVGDGKANSPSIQLSSIPKMALIFVRPVIRNTSTADYVLPITGININFNGRNGLLSGASQQQLYAMSAMAGVNQSWQEWCGAAALGGNVSDTSVGTFFTQGGILALQFGRDIECSNEYDAPSSIGQYNFAVNVNFTNECASAGNVELYIILVNSGFLASERGQSSSYTSIVSKADCMSVLNDVPLSDVENSQTLPESGTEALTGGRRRGYGKSGGGPSGGARSAGGMRKLASRLM
jgi:hypothetical protein